MTYYKLTDKKNQSYGGIPWGDGISHSAGGIGNEMCSPDVIHVYDHPLKAILFNPIHANFPKYNLWECEVEEIVANDSLKIGVKKCATIQQIKAPKITTNQKVRFAIYCALEIYHDTDFVSWANDWLSGKDRTAWAAEATRAAAWAAEAAAWAAAWAAEAAAEATRAAAWAAWAAEAAAWAAAGAVVGKLDFISLIEKAIREEKGLKGK